MLQSECFRPSSTVIVRTTNAPVMGSTVLKDSLPRRVRDLFQAKVFLPRCLMESIISIIKHYVKIVDCTDPAGGHLSLAMIKAVKADRMGLVDYRNRGRNPAPQTGLTGEF